MTPYLATSITRDRMCDDMSATSGIPPVSGVHWYSTPPMVSFVQTCTNAGSWESFHEDCAGTYVKFSSSADAAMAHLHHGHTGAAPVEHFGGGLFEDRFGKHRGSGTEIEYSHGTGRGVGS